MSHYCEGQVHLLMDALQARGITPAQLTGLGQNENGMLDGLALVLNNLANIVVADLKLALDKAFDPGELFGKGCTVWRGPANGNGLEGDEDVVPELDVVDFEQLLLETHLQDGESSIRGEEEMRRARASKNRQLGGKTLAALWENWLACKKAGKPEDSILERLRRAGKISTVIYFFGVTLRLPKGDRCTPYLYFDGSEWGVHYYWLDCHWSSDDQSAALASEESPATVA